MDRTHVLYHTLPYADTRTTPLRICWFARFILVVPAVVTALAGWLHALTDPTRLYAHRGCHTATLRTTRGLRR